jgi:hypothetical protein
MMRISPNELSHPNHEQLALVGCNLGFEDQGGEQRSTSARHGVGIFRFSARGTGVCFGSSADNSPSRCDVRFTPIANIAGGWFDVRCVPIAAG